MVRMQWTLVAFAAVVMPGCKAEPSTGVTTVTGATVEAEGARPAAPAAPSAAPETTPPSPASPVETPRPAVGVVLICPNGEAPVVRAEPMMSAPATPTMGPPAMSMMGPPATDEGSRSTGSAPVDAGGGAAFWGSTF